MAQGTPFTVLVPRPNTAAYNPRIVPSAQPQAADIDHRFLDAMRVRHNVFVLEQHVPPESEFDEDDPRSCHWVAYLHDGGDDTSSSQQPLGTIRVVPYPQGSHPTPGAAYAIVDGAIVMTGTWVKKLAAGSGQQSGPDDAARLPTADTPQSELEFIPAEQVGDEALLAQADHTDRATSLHDGKEPYVKLGRIAVLAKTRGLGLGRLLVQAALDWIQANPTFFDDHDASAAAATTETKFNGLVCLHAQVHALDFYRKLGFEMDAGMGVWWEEGIPHAGMFRRLNLNKKV